VIRLHRAGFQNPWRIAWAAFEVAGFDGLRGALPPIVDIFAAAGASFAVAIQASLDNGWLVLHIKSHDLRPHSRRCDRQETHFGRRYSYPI
jgi:hypothetical protein